MTKAELKEFYKNNREIKTGMSVNKIDENLKNAVETFINSIDDSLVRMIFKLRYLNGMAWSRVALNVGGGNSADGVRKLAERYLKRIGV